MTLEALRVVRSGAMAPDANMALDGAMLLAGEDAVLRIYSWKVPTVSIGRFQDAAPFHAAAPAHALVRRITGGGAICHEQELTYALVGPTATLGDTERLYVRVHDAIVEALRTIGVRARRIADGPFGPGARALSVAWCFAEPARHDVVAPDGRKLAGSAQRRLRAPSARVLQHGSLVLSRPALTPFCAAVDDQVDVARANSDLEHALVDTIARSLGLRPADGQPTRAETERAGALRESFSHPEARACPTSTGS